ncbi:hypothetical protein Q7P37_000044 [Cladosporium fusiforme]
MGMSHSQPDMNHSSPVYDTTHMSDMMGRNNHVLVCDARPHTQRHFAVLAVTDSEKMRSSKRTSVDIHQKDAGTIVLPEIIQGYNMETQNQLLARNLAAIRWMTRLSASMMLWFDDMGSRYNSIDASHMNTCHWVFENKQYLRWMVLKYREEHHGFL